METEQIKVEVQPTYKVVMQGSSDIYVVHSLDALHNSPGTTITLAEADKETLNKLLADETETAVIMDEGGNISVRYELINAGYMLIVFLVSNGQGQTYIAGYQYKDNVCRCIIKYKLADIGENETMLTADNWPNYITLPSGGSEWTKAENVSDINLYNAKELYIKLSAEGYGSCYPLYIYCPNGLGAYSGNTYLLTVKFTNLENIGVYYNGKKLLNTGSLIIKEVYYKL